MTIGCSVRPAALRARSVGTVVRFIGTGVGVARLVAVSMVKVDIYFNHPRMRLCRANQKIVQPSATTAIGTNS